MGLLKRVVHRLYDNVVVTDQTNAEHRVRFDTFAEQMVRPYLQDRLASVDHQSSILAGYVLTAQDGSNYTVYQKVPDFYKDEVLRYRLDLVTNNNLVVVKRYGVSLDAQGGIAAKGGLTNLYTARCKTITSQLLSDSKSDVQQPKNLLILSSIYPVEVGDVLEFQTFFKPAKVESVKQNYPGVQEVSFDRDPRWPA